MEEILHKSSTQMNEAFNKLIMNNSDKDKHSFPTFLIANIVPVAVGFQYVEHKNFWYDHHKYLGIIISL